MKAIKFRNPFNIKIEQLEIPTIGEYDILVQVRYCGICGTDLHIYEGQVPFVIFPIIPRHEFSGTIKAVGSEATNFSIGEKIAINPNLSCKDYSFNTQEYCYYCQKNRPHFCTNWEAIGVTKNGGFAEYVCCPSTSVLKIPPNVSLVEAVMMEPIACCLHGLHKLEIATDNTVLIIGAGPIGLLMVSLIKSLYKSKIILSEPNRFRRNLGTQLGADVVVDPDNEALQDVIKEETENYGVDVSIEAVGMTTTVGEALKSLNKGGKALIFGVSKPNDILNVNLFDLYNKELSLYGSFTNPHESVEALEILKNKTIKVSALISHTLELEELEDGLELMKDKTKDIKKIIVKIDE
jgi:threonine dehydrogenase-like Zn-dependent dehydrogenase